ncbi:hypothetical protein D3C71_1994030 [compost metagenome]
MGSVEHVLRLLGAINLQRDAGYRQNGRLDDIGAAQVRAVERLPVVGLLSHIYSLAAYFVAPSCAHCSLEDFSDC